MSVTAFIINGQEISGTYYGRMVGKVGKYEARRIMYRARNADDIIKFISAGMNKGWIFQVVREEDTDKPAVEAWIERNILGKEPIKRVVRKAEPVGLGGILDNLGLRR